MACRRHHVAVTASRGRPSRILHSQVRTTWATTSASTRFNVRSIPNETSLVRRISALSGAEDFGSR